MYHTKGQQACSLCHLAVQTDELVVASTWFPNPETFYLPLLALNGTQQPLFRPYQDLFCQRPYCHPCVSGRGPVSHCIHRDCYHYYRQFFPRSALRLRNLLELWPNDLEFLSQQNSEREKRAYKECFGRTTSQLVERITENNFKNLLRLMSDKLPPELLFDIVELSWPCALQKPVTILGENESLLEFSKMGKGDNKDFLEYAGELISITRLSFLGYSYITGLSIEECMSVGRRDDLSISIIRDALGVFDINFQGYFGSSRRGSWYKLIRTSRKCLKLRIHVKV